MKIKELRKQAGYRQSDFARKLGITPTSMWKIENNISRPSLALAQRIARILNCGLDDLGIEYPSERGKLEMTK